MRSPKLKHDSALFYYNQILKNPNWLEPVANGELRDRLLYVHNQQNLVYELDVAMWYGTLKNGNGRMRTFLKRMLSILYFGGLLYRDKEDNQWKPWMETQTPLAACLSHGGRILIQLPKTNVEGSSKFWNWMLVGVSPSSGGLATHGIKYEKKPYEHVYGDRYKCVAEDHGKLTAVKNMGRHYRLDVAMGGEGNKNPWTGKTIACDGTHGHLYLYYAKPTRTKHGAIMLSLESEAPLKTGQTGHAHTISAGSEEFTATGGAKWVVKARDKKNGFVERPDSKLRDRYDGMFIDLVGDGKGQEIKFIKDNADSFSLDFLTRMPFPPFALSIRKTLIPDYKTWKKSTSGTRFRKDVGIDILDELVEKYHSDLSASFNEQSETLKKMLAACYGWDQKYGNRHKNRKKGVLKLIELIREEQKTFKSRKGIHNPKQATPTSEHPRVHEGNRVRFLMDGEEYINALETTANAILEDIKKRRKAHKNSSQIDLDDFVPPKTYLRLAFWYFDRSTSRSVSKIILDLLRAGVHVDIILYSPTKTEIKYGAAEKTAEGNRKSIDALHSVYQQINKRSKYKGNLRTYIELYEGWIGSSNHQKIVIFSYEGQRTAIIGGFNLASYYYDDVTHTKLTKTAHKAIDRTVAFENVKKEDAPDRGYGWHDTAVLIQGPATVPIEREWLRRWRRGINLFRDKKNDRILSFFSDISLTEGLINDVPQKTYAEGTQNQFFNGVYTSIALTRTTKTKRINQIKEELADHIHWAQRHIYLENISLSDPDIIRALYKRLETRPNLKVVVVVNANHGTFCDIFGVPVKEDDEFSYLTRRGWLQLALRQPIKKKDRLTFQSGNSVNRITECREWKDIKDSSKKGSTITSITSTVSNRWLESDSVVVTVKKKPREIHFSDLRDFHGNFYFFTPIFFRGWKNGAPKFYTIELHSKLAIIDDNLVVGSANWSYRSMNYDGEISAFSKHDPLAMNTLKRLLSHYDYGKPESLAEFTKKAFSNMEMLLKLKENDQEDENLKEKLMIMPIEHPKFPWIRFQRTVPKDTGMKTRIFNYTYY